MMHETFLESSQSLLVSAATRTPGSAQHQSDLRRATSTTYYALFHALLRSNAETLVGPIATGPYSPEWVAIYRALGHRVVDERMKRKNWPTFSTQIQNFLDFLNQLRTKREEADYDPNGAAYTAADVTHDLEDAQILIDGFLKEPITERRILAVWLLIPVR